MRLAATAIAAALWWTGCSKEPAARRHVEHDDADRPAATPVAAAPAPKKVKPPRPAQVRQLWLKALGMTCDESCPQRVRMALADIHAVYELGFDPAVESIFVSYDAALGEPKDVAQPMLDAIKSAGYDPWLKKEGWPEGADAEVAVVLR